jgi:protein associated with RNAse G/E
MAGREVRVVYTKYDGSLHWHQAMRRLGADEHGVWLGAPAGTVAQRGYEPGIVIPQPHVLLVPAGTWWTATFNGEPARTEIYCDICTPARWPGPDEVTMADLDLDVWRGRADQRVELLDEDEFALHQKRYGYPDDVIREATAAASHLLAVISAGLPPFGGGYRDWLARV